MSIGNVSSAESTAALAVGARARAMVAAIGDKIELKYIEASQAGASDVSPETKDDSGEPRTEAEAEPVAEVATRLQLEHAFAPAAAGAAMAGSGLFLTKMNWPVNAAALQALYEGQQGSAFDVNTTGRATFSPEEVTLAIEATVSRPDSETGSAPEIANFVAGVIRGEQTGAAELSALLLEALIPPDVGASLPATGDDSGTDGGAHREPARSPLHMLDEGGIAHRYGTLPVLIAGQLVELDLVSLQQRQPDQVDHSGRRLIMMLNTQSFGRVQIEVRVLEGRLTLVFTGPSVRPTPEMARYADEIRGLGSRFGWNIAAVRYGTSTAIDRRTG